MFYRRKAISIGKSGNIGRSDVNLADTVGQRHQGHPGLAMGMCVKELYS